MGKTKDENGDGGKTENVDAITMIAQALQAIAANQQALTSAITANQQTLNELIAANQSKAVIEQSSPEYQAMLREKGWFDTFDKPVFQNGKESDPKGLPEETRYRAARLAAGVYCDGKLEVRVTNSGAVHLLYDAKGDKAFAFYSKYAMTFEHLIDRIWGEMQARQPAVA